MFTKSFDCIKLFKHGCIHRNIVFYEGPYQQGNVFCFLSSLPLLPPATTAEIGSSYLSSLDS